MMQPVYLHPEGEYVLRITDWEKRPLLSGEGYRIVFSTEVVEYVGPGVPDPALAVRCCVLLTEKGWWHVRKLFYACATGHPGNDPCFGNLVGRIFAASVRHKPGPWYVVCHERRVGEPELPNQAFIDDVAP